MNKNPDRFLGDIICVMFTGGSSLMYIGSFGEDFVFTVCLLKRISKSYQISNGKKLCEYPSIYHHWNYPKRVRPRLKDSYRLLYS